MTAARSFARPARFDEGHRKVTAVLGPTNTGKTHLAMERMLGYATGMIGFPLRLLARENYDRVVKLKGAGSVALITGEERIEPPHARWLICTVEAMPMDRRVEFLAIDECQLAADPERGHIFTERILHARGMSETMVMGSDTMRPMLGRLLGELDVIARPRFSSLTYAGPKKLTRLPRRSAVVAFSAAEVYEIAELMRRQRGGCAVVLGALSPRARNAQVAMYQSGEVDHLVATDAIGMGLNMDLDHVTFARLSKFDGVGPRRLYAPEIAQIAGRAGRHMNDGTFGTSTEVGPLDPELIEAVETHSFDPVTQVMWRNRDLDFSSVERLIRSLEVSPPARHFRRKKDADDHVALLALGRMEEVAKRAVGRQAVRLLWEVCQIPDFRRTMADTHAKLLAGIYLALARPAGRLGNDEMGKQINRLDRADGDIDQLSARIAHVRTWTYVTHRDDWIEEATVWRERTRAIEDKLSDALHEKLTQRFVDRRGAFLVKRLDDPAHLLAGVTAEGEVVVEGHPVGRLEGFAFTPDPDATGEAARRLLTAARRALADEISRRVRSLSDAPDVAITLGSHGSLLWRGVAIGRLVPGPNRLTPGVDVPPSELLSPEAREKARARLSSWMSDHIAKGLAPLLALNAASVGGAARGLAFQLVEAFGLVTRAAVAEQLDAITEADQAELGRLGVRFGVETIYVKPMLVKAPTGLRALLDAIHRGLSPIPEPPSGAFAPRVEAWPEAFYHATGFMVLGPRVIRANAYEKLAQAARRLARRGGFPASPELAALAGCGPQDLAAVLADLGYKAVTSAEGVEFVARRRSTRVATPKPVVDSGSPFAKLRDLGFGR